VGESETLSDWLDLGASTLGGSDLAHGPPVPILDPKPKTVAFDAQQVRANLALLVLGQFIFRVS